MITCIGSWVACADELLASQILEDSFSCILLLPLRSACRFQRLVGLADVVGALPRALVAAGHQVSVYLPRYRQTKLNDPQTVVRSITVPFDDRYRFCSVVT